MTRNLKALGLALLAVLAMSAIAAQGASAAENHEFEATANAVDITAHGENHEFTSGTQTVTCETATFTGSQTSATADEVRVTPTYSGHCTVQPADLEVYVVNNGCDYVFDSDTTENPHTGLEEATVSVDCNDEGSITFTDEESLCVAHIGDTHEGKPVNQDLHGILYENAGSGDTEDIVVDAEVDTITSVGTGFCPLIGIPSTDKNASYTGIATVQGYEHESDHGTEDHVGIRLLENTLG